MDERKKNLILGQEKEGKLPESCMNGFQRLLITTNFNPIHVEEIDFLFYSVIIFEVHLDFKSHSSIS